MKTTNWVYTVLAVCIPAFAGCKKSEQAQATSREYYGINVDWPKLDTEYANASPDLEAKVSLVKRAFRYAQFPQALVQLGTLANHPNLTEPQKKLVRDLVEQTRQVIAKMPPPPGP